MAISVSARTDLISIVVGMFNAAPGAKVLSDLTIAFEANQTRLQIATNLARSAEYLSIYPEFLTNAEFATKLVDNMVGSLVSAAAKADAVTLLTGLLNAKNTSTPALKAAARADVTLYALDALKAVPTTDATLGAAVTALNNKVDVAVFYSVDKQLNPASLSAGQDVIKNVTNTTASVDSAKESISGTAVAGQTYTLTTSPDSITGTSGNDTINGVVNTNGTNSTLTTADVINGGAGTDTLNITFDGTAAATMPAPTVSNVEVFNIRNVSTDTTALSVNANNLVGATQIWNDRGVGADLTVTNLATGAVGGIRGNGVAQISDASFGWATASAAATIAIADGVRGGTGSGANTAAEDAAATTVTISSAPTAVTINSTGAANTVNNIALGGSATSLTINATTGLTVAGAEFDNTAATTLTDWITGFAANAKITVTGAGAVSLGTLQATNVVEVDASANTGGTTATLNGVTTLKFTGGSGNDVVTTGAALTTGTVNAGAGTADRLVLADSTHINSAALGAKYSGFEQVQIQNGVTLDVEHLSANNSISAIRINQGATDTTVNNLSAAQAAAVTIVGTGTGDVVIGVKNATTVGQIDTLKVTVSGVSARTVDTLTAAGVEKLELTAATGTAKVTVSNFAHQAFDSIKLFGSSDIDFASAATAAVANTIVDGSAATGKLNLNFSNSTTNGIALTGGSNDDTLVGTGQADAIVGGAGNDTITAGNGIDTINISGGGENTIVLHGILAAANRDTITGFNTGTATGADKVSVQIGATAAGTAAGATIAMQDVTSAPTSAIAFNTTTNDLLELSFNLTGSGTANDLDSHTDGTGLLASLGQTLSVSTDQHTGYLVAYQDGKAYLYHVAEGGDVDVNVAAADIALIGVFNDVAVGSFVAANFVLAA